jgi:hypothetical protein
VGARVQLRRRDGRRHRGRIQAAFPRMFAEYKLRCADGRFGLGNVFVWNEGELTVYNLGTQDAVLESSAIFSRTGRTST